MLTGCLIFVLSSVIVRVNVMDVNNMAPVFSQSSYTIRLSEDTPVNTRLQGISASDSDTPPNAVIMYSASITSECQQWFIIN